MQRVIFVTLNVKMRVIWIVMHEAWHFCALDIDEDAEIRVFLAHWPLSA